MLKFPFVTEYALIYVLMMWQFFYVLRYRISEVLILFHLYGKML